MIDPLKDKNALVEVQHKDKTSQNGYILWKYFVSVELGDFRIVIVYLRVCGNFRYDKYPIHFLKS